MKRPTGFTIAELLISLVIIGLIATFAVPKVKEAWMVQQTKRYNEMCQQEMAMVVSAFTRYRLDHEVTSSFTFEDLLPYMNYVKKIVDGATQTDGVVGQTLYTCGTTDVACLRLTNGGMLFYHSTVSMTGTGTTNGVFFFFDPSEGYSGSTTGNGKSLMVALYANGRIQDIGQIDALTTNSGGVFNPVPAALPDWYTLNSI
ncbi:MAG: type II secretion system protein [Candidatus Melainabacteria bacterium]